ncbi:MAG: hypothetical protein QF440_06695 [Candidatus Thalassarchaeaceae archaeon]|jgi:hypothetical protein|nr:hypothetical protein [Candidatus Thalassarchaeaceae archaeon]
MRRILWLVFGTLLISIPSVSAEIYIPGPEKDTMMESNETYEYTLPNWMSKACDSSLACRYETVSDKNIVHTYHGVNQGGTLELKVVQGDAQTYNITVSAYDITPDELTVNTGSTLVFTVVEGDNLSNIILPWNPDKPELESTTPGFGVEVIAVAILVAMIRRRA